MLYVITGRDAPGSLATRRRARPAHLSRIRELSDAGRVVLAGPCPAVDSAEPGEAGFTGSVIVADFPSLDAARAWIAADPYVTDGVFESHEVCPFIKVLP
ncbi:MAG TPA: YciI family protein [Steroidobacteraceae bacterium]|nr:YciI family protein [Steroidobacteraceae bacterium]HQR47991.1 YciI family protein [Steroidobacteraceae bacterium]